MLQLIADRLPNLITVFFGIFLEASPFLLFGVLVSSVLEVAISADRISRFFPKNGLLGLLAGVGVSAAAPLCECGTVPIARGSVSKGVPLPAAIGFLLAAPVINPITVAATYTAFRSNLDILALRVVLGVVIALLIGGLFLLWPRDVSPLRGEGRDGVGHYTDDGRDEDGRDGVGHYEQAAEHGEHEHEQGKGLTAILEHAHHELSALMVYLVGAAAVAAILQVFLPRNDLLSLGQGPLLSVVIMMLVALVLSTCSSVDAFVALAFSTTFAPGAILAFLLVSPVLNLKSGALVIGVFRPQVVGPLLTAATATIALAAVAINYHLI